MTHGITPGTTIRFPCGGLYRTTEHRATHRLTGGPTRWTAPGIVAAWVAPNFRVDIGGDYFYLRHDAEFRHYAGGGWPNASPTAFIITREGDDLVLAVWAAEGERGPDWIDGVDG